MRISDVSIRNPVFAWMLMIGLIAFGGIGFSRMGVSQLPDVDFPVVTATITMLGAAPEVIESTIADPVEDKLMSVEGLRTITTTSTVGTLTATMEFELSRNIDAAVQEVQTKISAAQKLLPREVDPPIITKTNPDDQPIIWLALTAKDATLREIMTFARDVVKDQFTSLTGVGDVLFGGYVEPGMRVWMDPPALKKHNIAITDVVNTLTSESIETPGGDFDNADRNFNVRTMGEATNPESFGDIIISKRAGQVNQDPTNLVHLRQVARVERGLNEITRISRFNGIPAIGLGIVKQKGSNAVEVARRIKEKVANIKKTLPPGYEVSINFDTTRFIEDAIHELNFNLVMSALLTAIACWIFLGSLSATINVLLSIPTSIMGAFIVLYFVGFTLNTFTLLGLSLAIGIVVDDAIMVLENIFRHNEEGLDKRDAAIVGAREISFAAMAATIAIIAIFLPVAFMKGIIGKFFFQFGVTISVAVLLSLLEALTITPMRCSQFVTIAKRTDFIGRNFERGMDWLREKYDVTLRASLRHPWKVIAFALVFMFTSFYSVKYLGKEFSPPQDQSLFLVRLKTKVDASLKFTDSLVAKGEDFLRTRPEVRQFYVAIGGLTGSSYNSAIMFITMKAPEDRPIDPEKHHRLSQQEFMAVTRDSLAKIDPSLQVVVQDLSMRGFTASRGFPVEFTVRGPDWGKLADQADILMKQMAASGLMTDVDTDYLLGKPELEIMPNREQAALHGVSIKDIGTTINAMVGGVQVNQYSENGHRYYVLVQVDPKYGAIEDVKNLLVANSRNNLLPMKEYVTQQIKPSLQSITRIDRQRAISVFANVAPGKSQQDALAMIEKYAAEKLPPGYTLVFNGSAQTFKESFESLIFALIVGLFVAYMVLASQFNSFIDPISVLVALPFSVSGAFLALLIGHQSLNIYSMIGLVLLMGIVKKNSILLVEFTNSVRDKGEKNVKEALAKACPVRLRPIIMTSFATVVGAIPEALSFGAGSETSVPMAIAVIGGVSVSTLLTLYVVPSVYSLLSRLQDRDESMGEMKAAFDRVGNMGLDSHS